ncbi:hypothetical protein QJQ45_019177 [Haematococcus lacustris]|nr:hypothetical protein QJQ45_019177 [Haematococcus lacustris]
MKDLVERLQSKTEEAELAAAVQTRRASHAEAEVALLREQLADALKQVKELGWQINMAFGDSAVAKAKAGAATQPVAGVFDLLGWSEPLGLHTTLLLVGCGSGRFRRGAPVGNVPNSPSASSHDS